MYGTSDIPFHKKEVGSCIGADRRWRLTPLEKLQLYLRAFHGRQTMLRWALGFLIVAIVAALFGFTGIAAASAGIAKIIFLVFLVLFLLSLIGHLFRRV
jgi:uncharacterized membrane protein YtjA (UPF0391 family)